MPTYPIRAASMAEDRCFMLRHDAYTKFAHRNDILQVPSALNATGVAA